MPLPQSQISAVSVCHRPSISPTLAWQTSVISTGGSNWLDAALLMGSGNGMLTITVNTTGLMSDTYHGLVPVFDPAQPIDQATANVTLSVIEPSALDKHVWLPLIMR